VRLNIRSPHQVRFVLAAAVVAALFSPMLHFTGTARAATTVTLSSYDSRLLHDINYARTSRGLHALAVVAGTTDVAHGWSCHLAAYSVLAHRSNLAYALEHHGSALWTTYAENVGVDSSSYGADHLFRSYMNSTYHRANILDPDVHYVGLWTKRANGFRWNTIDFVGRPLDSYNYNYGSQRSTC